MDGSFFMKEVKMSEFKSLNTNDTKNREASIEEYWKEIDLLDQTFKTREDAEEYIIYDLSLIHI